TLLRYDPKNPIRPNPTVLYCIAQYATYEPSSQFAHVYSLAHSGMEHTREDLDRIIELIKEVCVSFHCSERECSEAAEK
ncbi:hypothetical protein PMAYCL1PPCAC_21085, partial [Pristionchus mayeri]